MKMKFENVVDGINRYLDKEIYRNLNDLQEFVARLTVGRINQKAEVIKTALITNGFARTLCLVDSEGMVDIDSILDEVKKEVERKGNLQIEIPMIGRLTFCPADVDVLKEHIYVR